MTAPLRTSLATPDITPAQLVALAGAIVTQLVDATVINGHTAQLLIGLAGIIVPAVFVLADAVIRHGRSKVAAASVAASSSAAATPPAVAPPSAAAAPSPSSTTVSV